jgi:linoleoyl-CoA desaturase
MPSTRYAEIAPRVKAICEEYGLPYNSGPLSKQLGMVHRTIIRLAFPGGKPRPKPGPYTGSDTDHSANGHARSAPPGPEGSGPEQADEGVQVSMPSDNGGES